MRASSSYYIWFFFPLLSPLITSLAVLLRGSFSYPATYSVPTYDTGTSALSTVLSSYSRYYLIGRLVSIHQPTYLPVPAAESTCLRSYGDQVRPPPSLFLPPRNLMPTVTAIRSRPVYRASAVRPPGSWLRLSILNRALGLIRLFHRLCFLMQRWGSLFF